MTEPDTTFSQRGWYIRHDSDASISGPYTEVDLRNMLKSGRIDMKDDIGEVELENLPPHWMPVLEQKWLIGSRLPTQDNPPRAIDLSQIIRSLPAVSVRRTRAPIIWKLIFAAIIFGFLATSGGKDRNAIWNALLLNRYDVVIKFQLWRMVTCVFLHGGFFHIFFNGLALFYLGPVLENAYQRWRFFLIFTLSAIGGSALSLAGHSDSINSIGASGALFGLIGAGLAPMWRGGLTFRFEGALGLVMRMLIPWVIINLIYGALMPGIDNYAHVGGLIAGFITARIVRVPGTTYFGISDIRRSLLATMAIAALTTVAFLVARPKAKQDYGKKFAAMIEKLSKATQAKRSTPAEPAQSAAQENRAIRDTATLSDSGVIQHMPRPCVKSIAGLSHSNVPADTRAGAIRSEASGTFVLSGPASTALITELQALQQDVNARPTTGELRWELLWRRMGFERIRRDRNNSLTAPTADSQLINDAIIFCLRWGRTLKKIRHDAVVPDVDLERMRRRLATLRQRAMRRATWNDSANSQPEIAPRHAP